MNGKTHMLKNWSIDRTKHKRFISYVEITNDLYEISYNLIWHIKFSVFKMSSVEDTYLVSKDKYKHQLVNFEQLINNGYCVLEFDSLAEIIKQVSLIKINFSHWKKSSCTCKYFAKKYFCAHIIVVSVGLNIIKIPDHCKNVNIGNLKKRGRPSNANRGTPLKTQTNVI
jgi:hypothetical protein